jgi:3-deoxy-D-manno-octulosonic-acid transferase
VYLLYDIALFLSAFFLVPYYGIKGMNRGRVRRGIGERFGFYDSAKLRTLAGRPIIWIHAVSVGETRAAIPLISVLREAYPHHALVLSNVTETGQEVSAAIKDLDLRVFFPFDFSWVIRRVLRSIRPEMVVIVETEIWPNFIRHSRNLGIPVVLVNGRISDRSYPRYRKVARFLRPVLREVSAFCMQSQQDADRIIDLGADPDRVHSTGNLKFDLQPPSFGKMERDRLRAEYSIPPGTRVWCAGSTHAGEEEQVLRVYSRIRETEESVFLILAPRHPERCVDIEILLQRWNLGFVRRSEITSQGELKAGDVLLVDTLGEMLKLYTLSDVVFVGGSLVEVGGHNVLEASMLKKPVCFGPHMHNFKEISRLVTDAGGGVQVANEAELLKITQEFLAHPEKCREMGEKGFSLIASNQGATRRSINIIGHLIPYGNP